MFHFDFDFAQDAAGHAASYGPDAEALFARMTTQPGEGRKAAIAGLISALEAAGIWAKLDALYLFAAHAPQAARLNWKADQWDAAIGGGAPDFVPDRGYYCDGHDDWIDLGFAPSQGVRFTQNSAMAGIWSRNPAIDQSTSVFGLTDTNRVGLSPRNASGLCSARLNSTAAVNGGEVETGYGLTCVDRSSATAVQLYKDGAPSGAAGSAASSARSSSPFCVGRGQNLFASNQVQAVVIGGHLTAQEHADLYAAMAAYMSAAGVAPLPAPLPSARTLAEAVILPDGASGATPGKGWTCTGLARLADGSWLVGNDGRGTEADPYLSSIVHLSADRTAILHEWTTAALGLEARSVQGVAWEPVGTGGIRGNIWFALLTDTPLIVKLPIGDDWSGGAPVSYPALSSTNGIAYDAVRDMIVTLRNAGGGAVQWFAKGAFATPLRSFPVTSSNYDQIWHDPAADEMLVSVGANFTSGIVERWPVSAEYGGPWKAEEITLAGADAIEGVVRVGADLVVANDGWFHAGSPALNRLLRYDP